MGFRIVDHQNPPLNFSTELQDMELRRELYSAANEGATDTIKSFGPYTEGDFALFQLVGLTLSNPQNATGTVRTVDLMQTPSAGPGGASSAYRERDLTESPTGVARWAEATAGQGSTSNAVLAWQLQVTNDLADAVGHVDYIEVRQTDT